MSNKIITQISLKSNEELIKRTKQTAKRYFHMVGRTQLVNVAPDGAPQKEWRMEGIDFIDAMVEMSSKEQRVVKLMKDCIRWKPELHSLDYVVELSPKSVHFDKNVDEFMPYNSFIKGYNALFKKDLMRRVSRNKYMLNPEFFIVNGELKEHYEIIWNEAPSYAPEVG